MSESEQAINVTEWKELHAELEEVSDKRNRLQAENNRLKALIQLTQKECDEAKNELRDMTSRRDHATAQWEECCEDRSRQVAALREQVQQMVAERDAVKEANGSQFRMVQALQRDVSQLQAEWEAAHKTAASAHQDFLQMVAQRDAARKFADDTQVELRRCRVEHNAAADMFEAENTYLKDTIQQLCAKQIHDDLPGMLKAIQLAVEQARELI